MSKKALLFVALPFIFTLTGCGKGSDQDAFGPSPGDSRADVHEPNEAFGPSPSDG